MSEDELDLPARQAIASERLRRGPPAGVKDRVRTRLSASIVGPSAGPPGSFSDGVGWLRRLARKPWRFVVVVAAGGLAAVAAYEWNLASTPEAPASPAITVITAPAVPEPQGPRAVERPRNVATEERREAVPPARRRHALDTLAIEDRLLSTAREQVVAGRYADAQESIDAHERRFAHGALTEEREALRIQLLARSRRFEEARARTRAFHERFPDSVFAPSVSGAWSVPP